MVIFLLGVIIVQLYLIIWQLSKLERFEFWNINDLYIMIDQHFIKLRKEAHKNTWDTIDTINHHGCKK